jgi:hypothetical protein
MLSVLTQQREDGVELPLPPWRKVAVFPIGGGEGWRSFESGCQVSEGGFMNSEACRLRASSAGRANGMYSGYR